MKAKLIEISANGDQIYETDGIDSRNGIVLQHLKTIILSGIDRAVGVEVGDSGTMTFHSIVSRGWYTFEKEKSE